MSKRSGNSVTEMRGSGQDAFTLTELLVILAVLAVLACLGSAALAGGRGRTRIVECASHLRHYDLAVQLYANEHHDLLPAPTLSPPFYVAPGNWPWDIPVQVVDQIAPFGMARNLYYCPANEAINNDLAWNFGAGGSGGGFRTTGYVATFNYIKQVPRQYQNSRLTPQSDTDLHVPAPNPSQRVLLADVTMSYNGNFTFVPVGGLTGSVTYRTSHLDGNYPLGGNKAMLDGHVEWREFSDMQARFGVPTFWW